MKAKEKPMRCENCGCFIGIIDFEKDNVNVEFTPDTYWSVEKTELEHKICPNRKPKH